MDFWQSSGSREAATRGVLMVSAPPIIMGGLNLKICQNFVGTKFFLKFVGG